MAVVAEVGTIVHENLQTSISYGRFEPPAGSFMMMYHYLWYEISIYRNGAEQNDNGFEIGGGNPISSQYASHLFWPTVGKSTRVNKVKPPT